MRVAFVGASHWHLPLYLDPALQIPGLVLAGVSDPDPAVSAALGQRLGCPDDRDYRELCRRERPDFVFALGRHADMAAQAEFLIGEGIPFALEKPCGLDSAELARIARLAAARRAFAAVPLVLRNGDFFRLLQDLAAEDGGVQHMAFRFIAGFAQRYLDAGCAWMLDPATAGGGCVLNLGPHFVDIVHALWGEAARPAATSLSNAAWGHPVEDYGALAFAGPGGALALVETGYLYPAPTSTFDLHFALRTPRHYLAVPDAETVEVTANDGARRRLRMHTTNVGQYPAFVRDVLERARRGQAPLADLDAMLPVMRLIEASYALAGPPPDRLAPTRAAVPA
ncbi:Gfo/Idh/MocA family oxidoreductase [Roseomonas sp. OT10]|uniref:Gfo/Idh/MocA family protein n=1 Tax=Roseomonas cutis TaxID=2897332 RepID=UPI001E3C64D7|nr:Gfo/Idh/MocA family oxidoreductase [Roseomonas sp. OT10]UFN48402.1 Gfo/Idh/MocA family oxidoreductase [Roseomonas sp. OT10]